MAASSTNESLSGLVERVTFFNEENGFAVLKVNVKGHRDLVTVVGTVAEANVGEWLVAEGGWSRNREHGLEFKAHLLKTSPPSTAEGIEKYLGSGLVKGIGPVYARKLVSRFGDKIFEIIEHSSARLEEVEGIGPSRRHKIKAAWGQAKTVCEIMVFLHSHGVGTSRAVRIYKKYGDRAIDQIRANPYLLSQEVAGIGFKTADQIAQRIGISRESIARVCAGLREVLFQATHEGNAALPRTDLVERSTELLGLEQDRITEGLQQLLEKRDLIQEEIDGESLVFLPGLRFAEVEIASAIRHLAAAPACYPPIDIPRALQWVREKTGFDLSPTQTEAVKLCLSRRVVIITGGPGVGKTAVLKSILLILRAKKVRCLLCAPTGRAAKRLTEATGMPAQTIHRLLEYQSHHREFARNRNHPLEADLVVVDETSMIDLLLMHDLLKAHPPGAGLALVGDVDQLPSVGPGRILGDLIESALVPVVRLTEVFRQSAGSQIVTAAHAIQRGDVSRVMQKRADGDFYFIERNTPEEILTTLLEVVTRRIPAKWKFDRPRDVQVLTPMNRGLLGVRELNGRLQEALNATPAELFVEKFGTRFRVGDKVIQTENDYDKEVFNGDIGLIERIDLEEQQLWVRVDDRSVAYEFGELDELQLAYAITIHKAQGSEFPAVVMPLAMQQYLLLQRNLIYTSVTRGKQLVVVIGEKRALATAIQNSKNGRRYSGLLQRLRSAEESKNPKSQT